MSEFDHEKLDVYQAGMQFILCCEEILTSVPRGRSYLRDQLRRAALSVVNNVAEGAGEFAPVEKRRFYRMSRRSATECAATLDVCRRLGWVPDDLNGKARSLLIRVVEMLTKLVQARER